MKVMIMGAGALGSYFGARLVAAGHAVSFIARGAHLEAMRQRGLRVESPLGDLDLPPVAAFADPAEAGPADVVLFMVKNYDVESAGAKLLPVLGPESAVITVQNGISAHRRLAAVIGPGRVAAGMVYMPASIPEPGVVRHGASFNRLVSGPLMDGRPGPLEAMAEALGGAGIEMTLVDDPEPALWEKFSMLSALAAVTCLSRLDLGPIRAHAETFAVMRAALDETLAVGQAVCPALEPAAGDRAWGVILAMGDDVHASMLDDLTRGKRLELEHISGEVSRLGAAHGIPTPVHDLAYALLRPYRDGAPA